MRPVEILKQRIDLHRWRHHNTLSSLRSSMTFAPVAQKAHERDQRLDANRDLVGFAPSDLGMR